MNTMTPQLAGVAAPVLTAINHVLDQALWAKQKLQPFAGKTICLEMPPFSPRFAISDDGRLQIADSTATPDLHIALPVNTPFLALQGSDQVIKAAQIKGPAHLADAFSFVLKNLRWDFEEDLSKVFGDVVAHRVATALKTIRSRSRQSAQNFTENVSEYLVEENRMLLKSADFAGFADEASQLSKALGSIEARIHRLQEKHK